MANIWIEGHGVFSLNNEKVQDLVSWLASNQAVQSEGTSKDFEGQQLLNEDQPGNPVPPEERRQINDPGARVGNPKSKPGTTFDHGGTWL